MNLLDVLKINNIDLIAVNKDLADLKSNTYNLSTMISTITQGGGGEMWQSYNSSNGLYQYNITGDINPNDIPDGAHIYGNYTISSNESITFMKNIKLINLEGLLKNICISNYHSTINYVCNFSNCTFNNPPLFMNDSNTSISYFKTYNILCKSFENCELKNYEIYNITVLDKLCGLTLSDYTYFHTTVTLRKYTNGNKLTESTVNDMFYNINLYLSPTLMIGNNLSNINTINMYNMFHFTTGITLSNNTMLFRLFSESSLVTNISNSFDLIGNNLTFLAYSNWQLSNPLFFNNCYSNYILVSSNKYINIHINNYRDNTLSAQNLSSFTLCIHNNITLNTEFYGIIHTMYVIFSENENTGNNIYISNISFIKTVEPNIYTRTISNLILAKSSPNNNVFINNNTFNLYYLAVVCTTNITIYNEFNNNLLQYNEGSNIGGTVNLTSICNVLQNTFENNGSVCIYNGFNVKSNLFKSINSVNIYGAINNQVNELYSNTQLSICNNTFKMICTNTYPNMIANLFSANSFENIPATNYYLQLFMFNCKYLETSKNTDNITESYTSPKISNKISIYDNTFNRPISFKYNYDFWVQTYATLTSYFATNSNTWLTFITNLCPVMTGNKNIPTITFHFPYWVGAIYNDGKAFSNSLTQYFNDYITNNNENITVSFSFQGP